jgi:CRP-like cAMP-binding protein
MIPNKPTILSISEKLKSIPIFTELEEELLLEITNEIKIKKYRKNRYIYQIGDPSNELHFLMQGNLKIGTHSRTGKEVIKSVIYPEAMFGEMALFGEKQREDFAFCLENDTIIFEIDADAFNKIMMKNPSLAQNVISLLGKKLHFAEKRIESLVFKDARERIIDFLKDNAKNFGQQIGYELLFKHSLTQQDIANFTGTSRQTVTSVLNDLKKSNQIYFKRKSILIRDMATLS